MRTALLIPLNVKVGHAFMTAKVLVVQLLLVYQLAGDVMEKRTVLMEAMNWNAEVKNKAC